MKKFRILKGDSLDLEVEEVEGYEVNLKTKWDGTYPALVYQNDRALWFCINEFSGLAYHGLGQKNKKSAIEEAQTRLNNLKAKEDLDKIIHSQISIDERLKKFKGNKIKFKQRINKVHKLEHDLKIKIPLCRLSLALGKASIDVVRLDKILGVPVDTSLSEFLTEKYGEEVSKQIKQLI